MRFALAAFGLLVLASAAFAAPVTFRFAPPEGRDVASVSVRGTFNDWGETAMARGEGGVWSVTIDLPPGEHQYKYFIDGEWPGDMSSGPDGGPIDADAQSFIDDGFGGKNAVRVVGAGAGAAAGAATPDARRAPQQPEGTVRIHYHRPDGAYEGWGLHAWEDADHPAVTWTSPLAPGGTDGYGLWWDVKLKPPAQKVGFIVHRGDTKDPGADMFLEVATHGREVWLVSGRPEILTQRPDVSALAFGDLSELRAHWLDRATIAWRPNAPAGATVSLHADPEAKLELTAAGVQGGATARSWTLEPAGRMPENLARRFPHLRALDVYRVTGAGDDALREALRGQVVVAASADGRLRDASGLQIAGVLDDLYAADGAPDAPPLGVSWSSDVPRVRVWAPTARRVSLVIYPRAAGGDSVVLPMGKLARLGDAIGDVTNLGTWELQGQPAWEGSYYRFAVEAYVPATQRIESYTVTDPYSRSLSRNSRRSQIVRMHDPALAPDGWTTLAKPPLAAPEDAVIYELHVRDFSVFDRTVPAAQRGTYLAFTGESDGTRHLRSLAAAGLTHVHLLPVFDIATIDEDRSAWADPGDLSKYPPDSEAQQAAVARVQGRDGYNWGYDPFHYGVPEGSYSTDPEGPARILEFRRMVQALNGMGLRVVMDVVYNHTNASGMDEKSVLDRVVPGYYHRLNEAGRVETSTCCQNTASEHMMMERLMIDDVVHWARDYKVDGFRFDLMGHHLKRNMVAVRQALDALTPGKDGVDGKSIILYGEGWDFGEVGQGKRGQNATQQHMAGTGIATFNDRIRDAIRGGNPFGDRREQGFATGLYVAPNGFQGGGAGEKSKLLEAMDRIRVGMAGNLAAYRFTDRNGRETTGAQMNYGGYTRDPQESINYASAHDNETLWDKLAYAAPQDAGVQQRARMQTLGLAAVLLGQGVPFLHAGSEALRSKSMDADSYNSGDWFNGLDWTYASNRFGIGLPIAEKNRERWPIIRPLLGRAELAAKQPDIEASIARAEALLAVRRSSPLFRLRTAGDVQARVRFHNTGPQQTPGLIVMSVHDDGDLPDLDPAHERIVVLLNARPEPARVTVPGAKGSTFVVHPALAGSGDVTAGAGRYDASSGTFEVPAWTAGVFVER